MKIKFLFFFSLFLCVLSLSGKGIDVTANGRVSAKFTKLNNEFALLTGFNGSILINDSLILGAGGYGLATDNKYECSQECIDSADDYSSSCHYSKGYIKVSDLSFAYGGLIVGYQFNPVSFLDIELKGLIGGGRHSSHYSDYSYYRDSGNYDFKVSFFVFEPEIMLKLVITKYVAVAVGISYRVVAAMNSDTAYSFSDLSNVAGTFDICLGSF